MDMNTLLDGMKITRSAKCRTKDGQVSINFTVDFSGVTLRDVLVWATSDRTIAGQRAWEKMSQVELMESVNGQTLLASSIGTKVKSRTERIAELVNIGIPEQLAITAIDDPGLFEKVMATKVELEGPGTLAATFNPQDLDSMKIVEEN